MLISYTRMQVCPLGGIAYRHGLTRSPALQCRSSNEQLLQHLDGDKGWQAQQQHWWDWQTSRQGERGGHQAEFAHDGRFKRACHIKLQLSEVSVLSLDYSYTPQVSTSGQSVL